MGRKPTWHRAMADMDLSRCPEDNMHMMLRPLQKARMPGAS
jgi:hypothetical protein